MRFNVLKKQIASCVYNNSAFKSPDELKKLVKKKFNTSSNIKMGSHVMIEQYVDWLVELNINAISKETCRLISKLGMIEYSELVDILADEFDGLCVDDLDLEICMAIYNNGEIIDVDSTTLVKCPGAKSGETYVRREIRMD